MSEPVAGALLFAVALACASVLLLMPRAVAPLELPSLMLPEKAVAVVIASDEAAAKAAPRTERVEQLEALYMEQGRMERVGVEDGDRFAARRRSLEAGYKGVVAESGEAAALRMRARAVVSLEAALELALPDEQAKAVLGSLSAILEREGASRDGYLVAPRFVVRTLHKARWNLLHGLTPTHAFVAIERRAYFGWQALHAVRVPLPSRIEALHGYGLVGGDRVEEALGVLLYRMGDSEEASRAFAAAYAREPNLRVANYLAAARASAAAAASSAQ
jgi:hypothetical protein